MTFKKRCQKIDKNDMGLKAAETKIKLKSLNKS